MIRIESGEGCAVDDHRRLIRPTLPIETSSKTMQSPNKGDKGRRFRARLEATSAGLQELAILRETQEAMIEHAKSIIRKGEKMYSRNVENDKAQVSTVYFRSQIYCFSSSNTCYFIVFFIVRNHKST